MLTTTRQKTVGAVSGKREKKEKKSIDRYLEAAAAKDQENMYIKLSFLLNHKTDTTAEKEELHP